MSATVLLAAALAPGLFWLWFFLRARSYRPNPRRLIAVTFFLGMLSVFPAALFEALLIRGDLDGQAVTARSLAGAFFLVVGPVEELSKFLAVRLLAARSLHFDEPLDGLQFSAAASLGFASAENIFYAIQYGPQVMVTRGPVSTLGHVVFGAFWGLALAVQRQDGPLPRWLSLGFITRRRAVVAGFASAAVAHGLFNFFVSTDYQWAGLLMIAGGAVWVTRLFRWAGAVSPFRLKRNVPTISCPVCGVAFRLGVNYCSSCNEPVSGLVGDITCSYCGKANRSDARFCTACGDQFVPVT